VRGRPPGQVIVSGGWPGRALVSRLLRLRAVASLGRLMFGGRFRSLVAVKLRGGIPRVSPAFAPALVFNGGSDMPHAHLEREGVILVHPV
jgi:hypothetical protein